MLRDAQRTMSSPGTRRSTPAAIGLVLLTVLVAVNALAIWGIVSARRSVRAAARADLELQTQVHARTLEALLANLRADLLFLSQSPPIAKLPAIHDQEDPMARRWLRLDAEATLLLFFAANPAVERIEVHHADGSLLMVAGLLDGAPQILPPEPAPEPRDMPTVVHGSWAVGSPDAARLDSWIEAHALLGQAAPGVEERLRLELEEPTGDVEPEDTLSVAVPVVDDQWTPPVAWWLLRREMDGQFLRSFELLSRRYRTTLAVNVAVILLTLALAVVAYRQVQSAARLEAENEQQARSRELERRLMHSDRLASVGRLAAGLAHEINNPLEGMSNFLSVLEEDLRGGDAAGASRWTPKLRQGLDRAASVIRQVLSFSNPARVPKEWVDVAQVLDETIEFVGSNPAFREVEIRRRVPEDGVGALANRTTLGQLFLNLLINACEAEIRRQADGTTGHGLVEVDLRVEDGAPPTWLSVTVLDRGSGFDEEALDHLFEPFYSGRGSSGLGLAVCQDIVQDLGGRITASNRHGGGAKMQVELPVRKPGAANETP